MHRNVPAVLVPVDPAWLERSHQDSVGGNISVVMILLWYCKPSSSTFPARYRTLKGLLSLDSSPRQLIPQVLVLSDGQIFLVTHCKSGLSVIATSTLHFAKSKLMYLRPSFTISQILSGASMESGILLHGSTGVTKC
jgi:hypothetical protein